MDLIVETGVGVANANTYVTAAETAEFLAARGRESWDLLPLDQQKIHIVNGADYLNAFYGWGLQLSDLQTMAIPTLQLDYVPTPVKRAQMLLAYEASLGDLSTPTDGASIKSTKKKLDGVGEKETVYQDDAPPTGRRFPFVEALLQGYVLSSANASIQVVRRLVG